MCIQENHFDRNKVFYPYVMQYIFTLHGIIEIFSRWCVKELKKAEKIYGKDKIFEDFIKYGSNDEIRFILKEQGLTPLLGELSLYSKFMKCNINIDIDMITDDAIANYDYLLEHFVNAAGYLIVMGYESTKHLDDRNSELWNFFYHCRNAAAHGCKFKITNPRFPARWGNLEITKNMDGTNLINTPYNEGLLALGDPIRLLWEIEQKYL